MSNLKIEDIIRDNKTYKYQQEFETISDATRKKLLQKAIFELTTDKLEKSVTKIESFNNSLDKTAQLMFKQPWHKLQSFQKEEKIKEYVNDKFKNHKNIDEIIKFYLDRQDSLKTAKDVIYDLTTCKITNIPNVIYEDKVINKKKKQV